MMDNSILQLLRNAQQQAQRHPSGPQVDALADQVRVIAPLQLAS